MCLTILCRNCGDPIRFKPGHFNIGKRYCNKPECRKFRKTLQNRVRKAKKRVTKYCVICGKPLGRKHQKYCCKRCAVNGRNMLRNTIRNKYYAEHHVEINEKRRKEYANKNITIQNFERYCFICGTKIPQQSLRRTLCSDTCERVANNNLKIPRPKKGLAGVIHCLKPPLNPVAAK